MDRQGETAGERRPEDDWWHDLYEEGVPDTGPQHTGDTLDDRFASAASTVDEEDPPSVPEPPSVAGVPGFTERAPAARGWADDVLADLRGSRGPDPRAPEAPEAPEVTAAEQEPQEPPAPPAPGEPAEPKPPENVEPHPPENVEPHPPENAEPHPPESAEPHPPESAEPTPSAWEEAAPDVPVAPAPREPEPGPGDRPAPATMRLRQVSVTDTLTDADWGVRHGGSYVGGGPPTYEAEPTTLPETAPGALAGLVPDTVLDGARYGSFTLRAAATRGDSPRYRGEQRRDALLTARFGGGDEALILVALATGARGVPRTDRAAVSLVHWIGEAVGRSRARLSDDIRAGRRGALKAGLHRLTGRTSGLMRAQAEESGADPAEYTAGLRCLLLSADAGCRTRVFFGTGPGGLFRLRDDEWQDLEPAKPTEPEPEPAAPVDPRLIQPSDPAGPPPPGFGAPPAFGPPTAVTDPAPEPAPFTFRASEGRPGDVLLLCSPGFAEPLRGAPGLAEELAGRWRGEEAPGLAAFLADVQLRAKGFADDRTAAAIWES